MTWLRPLAIALSLGVAGCGLVLDLRKPEDPATADAGAMDGSLADGGTDAGDLDAWLPCEGTCAWETCNREVCNEETGICEPVPLEIDVCDGTCAAEIVSCEGDADPECPPPSVSLEECNGIDDDCDGVIDDGLVPPEGGCLRGEWSCVLGVWVCTPDAEIEDSCNFVDDDADGLLDEDCDETDPGSGCVWVRPGAATTNAGSRMAPVPSIAAAMDRAEGGQVRICLLARGASCPGDAGGGEEYVLPAAARTLDFVITGGFVGASGERHCDRSGYDVVLDPDFDPGVHVQGFETVTLHSPDATPAIELSGTQMFFRDVRLAAYTAGEPDAVHTAIEVRSNSVLRAHASRIEFPITRNSRAVHVYPDAGFELSESCPVEGEFCHASPVDMDDAAANGLVARNVYAGSLSVSGDSALYGVYVEGGTAVVRRSAIRTGVAILGQPLGEPDGASFSAAVKVRAAGTVILGASRIDFALGSGGDRSSHAVYVEEGAVAQIVASQLHGEFAPTAWDSDTSSVFVTGEGSELSMVGGRVDYGGAGYLREAVGLDCNDASCLAVETLFDVVPAGSGATNAFGVRLRGAARAQFVSVRARATPRSANGTLGLTQLAQGLRVNDAAELVAQAGSFIGGCGGQSRGATVRGVLASSDTIYVGMDCEEPGESIDSVGVLLAEDGVFQSVGDTISGGHAVSGDTGGLSRGIGVNSPTATLAITGSVIEAGEFAAGHLAMPAGWSPLRFSHVVFVGGVADVGPFARGTEVGIAPEFLGPGTVWGFYPDVEFPVMHFEAPLLLRSEAYRPGEAFGASPEFDGHPTIHSGVDHDGEPRLGADGRVTAGAYEHPLSDG